MASAWAGLAGLAGLGSAMPRRCTASKRELRGQRALRPGWPPSFAPSSCRDDYQRPPPPQHTAFPAPEPTSAPPTMPARAASFLGGGRNSFRLSPRALVFCRFLAGACWAAAAQRRAVAACRLPDPVRLSGAHKARARPRHAANQELAGSRQRLPQHPQQAPRAGGAAHSALAKEPTALRMAATPPAKTRPKENRRAHYPHTKRAAERRRRTSSSPAASGASP